ncbi:MAG: hypothetical protein KAJ51_03000 [Thermoplasmata archaeon]|nr:hypothetical protein [Thermoplasmata archaeon]
MELKDAIHLEKYIEDKDTAKHEIEFEIVSNDNANRIKVDIDNKSYIDIKLIREGYTGFANVVISAYDGTTTIEQSVKIFATLEEMTTSLKTPPDGAKLSTKSPQLSWYTNIPAEFEAYKIAYNLYFSKDKSQVETHNSTVIIEEYWTAGTYFPKNSLTNGSIYYWTVIPLLMDKSNEVILEGECIDGAWQFMIDLSAPNEPPSCYLISPDNKAVLKEYSAELKWEGYDPNGDSPLFYELYLGTDKDLVSAHDETVEVELSSWTATSHIITNLTEDAIYYWTIVPNDGKPGGGVCLDDVWEFGINKINARPEVTLKYPINNDIVGVAPELYWTCEDPDPLETFEYFLYISNDDKKVSSLDDTVLFRGRSFLQNSIKISPPLTVDSKYYWIVMPQDGTGMGDCVSGIWSFTVKEGVVDTNYIPKVSLLYPEDGAIISTTEVKLQWLGSDENKEDILTYNIYFGTDRNSVKNYELSALHGTVTDINSYKISYLKNGTTYYWAVIPNDGRSNGLCLNKHWNFRVDLTLDGSEGEWPDDTGNGDNITIVEDDTFYEEFEDLVIGAIIITIIVILISAIVLRGSKPKYKVKAQDPKEERVEKKAEDDAKPTTKTSPSSSKPQDNKVNIASTPPPPP